MLFVRRFTEAMIAGLIGGFVVLIIGPVLIGWRPYTVLTGSMRPGIQPGDVVIDRPVSIDKVHIGEVVTFSDPTRHGELVTHRIRSIAHQAGTTNVETRGDANTGSEHWTIKTGDRVGLVVYKLPKIGRIAVLARSTVGILVIIVVPVVLIGFGLLRKIWQEDDDESGPAPDGDGPAAEPSLPDSDEPAVKARAAVESSPPATADPPTEAEPAATAPDR